MGPKRFSAVVVRKTRAQNEGRTKFVDLLEFGGSSDPQDPPPPTSYGPAKADVQSPHI